MGSDINYAFIIQNDMIIEKSYSGYISVYDSNMNRSSYKPSSKELNDAINNLNSFYK